MRKTKVTIINRTKFKTKDIRDIVNGLLQEQLAPDFYLLCQPINCKGIVLTNLDKPTMIIFIKNLRRFTKILVHELTHIQQHANGYVDEDEANEREIVVSDEDDTKGTILNKLKL